MKTACIALLTLFSYLNVGAQFTLNDPRVSAGLTGARLSFVSLGDDNNDDNISAGSELAGRVLADSFDEDTLASESLTGVNAGSVSWGDYDNDGDLDILLSGQDTNNERIANVFRNDAGSVFTDIGVGLTGVAASSGAWGDYNNDGHLDILLTGFDSNGASISNVYRNNGDGSFSEIGAGLTGVLQGSAAWGDYDNDGDLDLLVTGFSLEENIAKVYRNDGGNFNDINAGLSGVQEGSAVWADFDNDGDLDILLSGSSLSEGSISKIYRNDGNENFVDIDAGLIGLATSAAAWGDYDNDGDVDILLSGASSIDGRVTKIYRNDGNENFNDINAELAGVASGALAWGDCDNDGDLDILLTGFDNQFARISLIYRNDGNGVFTDIDALLEGVIFSSVGWADYDNDGDLDISLTGSSVTSRIAKIYTNSSSKANTPPTTPAGLAASLTETALHFQWQPAADNETAQDGLTYNLRVGTSPGGTDILTPMSMENGVRQIAQSGNSNHSTSKTISITDILLYPEIYWSVQAVDNSFSGSDFAEEESFGPQIFSVQDIPNDQGGKVTIKWKASSLDNNVNLLSSYSVWRAIPEVQQSNLLLQQGNGSEEGLAVLKLKNEFHFQVDKLRDLVGNIDFHKTTQLNGETYAWEWLATLPAHRRPIYSYTAETLFDSMATTDGKHFFLVAAHTNDANVFFDSRPDSGFSVDNLPPAAPVNLAGQLDENGLILRWNRNIEPDLKQYLIYRSNLPNIDAKLIQPFASTQDTAFIDATLQISGNSYFVVVAQDSSDNLSANSNEIAFFVTDIHHNDPEIPNSFALFQNFPNPFNPTTQIRFSLAMDSRVKLEIYSLRGEKVATLIDDHLQAGFHTMNFEAENLSSGPYFYKLQAGSFTQTRKMVLLR